MAIHRRLVRVQPNVAVLTEARMSTLQAWPAREHASVGFYPGTPDDGAKVAIVADSALSVVDHVPTSDLMANNYLAVDVTTEAGALRVIGVVVRYRQIAQFIDELPEVLAQTVEPDHTVLAGDFNLRVPGGPRSKELVGVLADAGLTVRTGGHHLALDRERPLIDHIAASNSVHTTDLHVWPRRDRGYRNGNAERTDHAGAAITLRAWHV